MKSLKRQVEETHAKHNAATKRMKRWQEDEEFSIVSTWLEFLPCLSLPGTGLGASHVGQGTGLGGDEEGEEEGEARPSGGHSLLRHTASGWAPSSRQWEANSLHQGEARASPKHPRGRCWSQPTSNCTSSAP